MTRRRPSLPVLVVAAILASFLIGPADAQIAATGHTWIDAPLTDSTIAAVPATITAHATAPSGVAAVRLTVDGIEVTTATPETPDTLVTVRFEWTPADPGFHVIEVTGRDTKDAWATPDAITVFVAVTVDTPTTTTTEGATTTTAPPTTTTTTRPTTTTTTVPATTTTTTTATTTQPPTTTTQPPTTTTQPATTTTTTTQPPTTTTTTACVLGTPVPTGPTGTTPFATPTLTWSYTGCDPDAFTIQIARETSFVRIDVTGTASPGSARTWQVNPPLPVCNATYHWRMRAVDRNGSGPWSATASFTYSVRGC